MTYEKLVRNYLKLFQAACRDAVAAGVSSLEMATRPVVHKFVAAMVDCCKHPDADVTVQHDVFITRKNKPDWRIEDRVTFGVFCLGDHKSLALSGPLKLSAQEDEQIQRYLELGRPVFVFDGIEILYFTTRGAPPARISLVPKPIRLQDDWAGMAVDGGCESLFKSILQNPGFRKWTERQLIEQLARRGRLLVDFVKPLLDAPPNSGSSIEEDDLIRSLHALQAIAQKHHDPSLQSAESCAEFIAQVLTFGLFYVHTRLLCGDESPEERRTKIEDFWKDDGTNEAKALRPFKALTDLLGTSLVASGLLRDWHSDVTGLLAHAEYMGKEKGPQDFHALFEQFLTAFSPRVRFDRGAFYTPSELTDWVVKAVNSLSAQQFGQEVAAVAEKIIDPCCGTGGFLESVVRHCIPATGAAPLLVGFEVLPAPYALAHYRLAGATFGTAYAGKSRILLTDTLADNLLNTPVLGSDGFSDELREAYTLVQPPMRVVLGNPPSSIRPVRDSVRNVIERLLNDFRPPDQRLSDRQNIQKALNNEAVRFLRWCAQRVIDSGRGIVAVVLPGAFAHAASFKYARRWLAERFQAIYVLELDEDVRVGSATQSLFQVKQGRIVLLAALKGESELVGSAAEHTVPFERSDVSKTRQPGAKRKSAALIESTKGATSSMAIQRTIGNADSHIPSSTAPRPGAAYADLFVHSISRLSVPEKKSYLVEPPALHNFERIELDKEPWLFTATQSYPAKAWAECWPLTKTRSHEGVFCQKCSGIKAAPTALLFHTSDVMLERRCKALGAGGSFTNSELIQNWFSGQMKPPRPEKLTTKVRAALRAAGQNADLRQSYLFRPFVRGRLINSEALWQALDSAPGAGTRSRPEVRSAFAQGAVGIALAPAPKDIGHTLTRFVTFVWDLPDNDIAARGDAMLYCDLYPKTNPKDGSINLGSNLSLAIEKLFDFATSPNRHALYYTFAMMSSPAYLEAFEGALYVSADPDSPPRVPIAADTNARRRLSNLGEKLAEYENFTTRIHQLPSLAASWKTGVTELKYRAFSYSEDSLTLTLIGEGGAAIDIAGVPERVMGTSIAGHLVIEKWLRERKYSYLRTTFKDNDLHELLDVVSRIERQHELLDQVDVEVMNILSGELVAPPAVSGMHQ
jgi:hypothetical protein